MLKLKKNSGGRNGYNQPPSGGCVLKLSDYQEAPAKVDQPPSGGCVLKQRLLFRVLI